MLQGYPTKNGTGISIFGDYGDLNSLYSTVHEIANSLDEYNERLKAQHQLLMNFAYEIRKAYSGQRLTDKLIFNGDDKEMHYYGFQCVWTDILIFISALRHNAGYVQTDKLQQANMYMLEYVVERALFEYDSEGANFIQHFIGQRINVTNKYAFIIYQALHIKFVSDRQGKKRFRNIPKLIGDYFSEWRQEYKDLIASFEISAKEQNCKITDLEFNDFPEIKW
ncbi:DUF6904 family protein [Labilibaculum euxinus]|uniref:Uncharacterized protein n=1 Tax=Labilibaculum euxinus TaxID=2686357 RepID=A0A7M4DAQ0_9BACT|nr:hypothetical protein [Labilibaculum euxinus]MUP39729.1 hypothetical protein [Labilibaculum euxinus]MVB08934.1 hypothetical protein [Labilibaculum euxinus]